MHMHIRFPPDDFIITRGTDSKPFFRPLATWSHVRTFNRHSRNGLSGSHRGIPTRDSPQPFLPAVELLRRLLPPPLLASYPLPLLPLHLRRHPNADKLLILALDDGTPEGRQVCAGLRGIYQPNDLIGRQNVIVANLAPRKMRGEVSQGMLLAASGEDRSQVIVLSPIAPIAPGSRVG